MRRKLLAIIGIITLAVVSGLFFFVNKPPQVTITDNERFLQFLSSEFTGLNYKGEPIFEIDSIAKFEEKWYIINISSLSESSQDVPVYFILLETNDILQVILGPDTYFTEREMLQYNVPDSIMKELL